MSPTFSTFFFQNFHLFAGLLQLFNYTLFEYARLLDYLLFECAKISALLAPQVLGSKVKDKSVEVVQHKYGEEAGKVYRDTASAAGNAAVTYMNVSSLGVKGMVKRTAKDTAKGVGKRVLEAHVPKADNNGNGNSESK